MGVQGAVSKFVPLLPVFLLGLYVWLLLPPEVGTGEVVSLAGDWLLYDVDAPTPEGLEGQPSQKVEMPGYFHPGNDPGVLWLRKRVRIPPSMQGKPLAFFYGDARTSRLTVFLDGRQIFRSVVADNGVKIPPYGGGLASIPPSHTDGELHRVDVRFDHDAPIEANFGDPRIYLGTERTLGPYATRVLAIELNVSISSTLCLLMLAVVLAVLWRQEIRLGHPDPARRYAMPIVMQLCGAFYNTMYHGFSLPHLFPNPTFYTGVHVSLLFVLVGAAMRFNDEFWLGSTTKFTKFVGAVFALAVLIFVGLGAFSKLGFLFEVYFPFMAVVIVAMFSIAVTSVRGWVADRTKPFGALMAVTTLVMSGAAIHDVLREFFAHGPWLSGVALLLISGVAAIIALGGFLELATSNIKLSGELAERNVRLNNALETAEESTRVKTAFFANVSHEIRTPLNAILNLPIGIRRQFQRLHVAQCGSCSSKFELDSAEEQVEGVPCPACGKPALERLEPTFRGDPDRVLRDLDLIESSSEHLMSVVNDILDISRLEGAGVELERDLVSLTKPLDDAVKVVSPIASGKDVALESEVTVQPDETVSVDVFRFSQVLVNLLNNAIKFSDAGAVVSYGVRDDGDQYVYFVRDRGPGIAEKDQELIFASFRQVASAHSAGGSGLGLAIARQLVTLHGGEIWVESNPGEGATFFVSVPKPK